MQSALETELERACKLLELADAQSIEDSVAAFEEVALTLAARRETLGIEEARRLQAAARKAGMLLNLAARFHTRWRDILSSMGAGYTAHGSPAALPTRARISISG
jgi:hypothetical protein